MYMTLFLKKKKKQQKTQIPQVPSLRSLTDKKIIRFQPSLTGNVYHIKTLSQVSFVSTCSKTVQEHVVQFNIEHRLWEA